MDPRSRFSGSTSTGKPRCKTIQVLQCDCAKCEMHDASYGIQNVRNVFAKFRERAFEAAEHVAYLKKMPKFIGVSNERKKFI